VKRKEFLKSSGLCGLCACVGLPVAASASDKLDPEFKTLQRTVEFVHLRFAKLIDLLKHQLDIHEMKALLEELGRECSREFAAIYGNYKGDLDGFLKMCRRDWKMSCEHDPMTKKVVTYGEKTGKCFCPFVDESRMSPAFCNCSLGWQKETFSAVIGKPVEAKILSSVLRGGRSCDFAVFYG